MLRIVLISIFTAVSLPAAEYKLKASPENTVWGYYSAQAKPVLTIKSGDTVEIQNVWGNPNGLVAAGLPADEVQPELREIYQKVPRDQRGPGVHILTGPIAIEGAEPGDVLEVRIREVHLDVPYAWNTFGRNSGFLTGEFGSKMKIIPLDREHMVAHFAPGIEIPLKPFFGSMGVAPDSSAGKINSGPPGNFGGNIDNKELVAGTTLYLPVHARGALFEAGDGHAAMGNGEVDITALETSLSGVFQFIVRKDMHLKWPRAETPTDYITMGLDPDLTAAAKLAVHETIDFLVNEKKMSREDAYMLTSVGVDFDITQLVDGTVGVHGMIPKSLFQH
ncbi:MAG: acetamidase/formamidase family protein [Bryobacteraceae bacterium]